MARPLPLSRPVILPAMRPTMTTQQLADMALSADRDARRLEREESERAMAVRIEADAIADEFAKRGI